MKCQYCGNNFQPKPRTIAEPQNEIHAMMMIMSEAIFDGTCDNKECVEHAQFDADQFDAMRKGEF